MERIGDSYSSVVPNTEDYHHGFFAGGSFWVFSRKFVDQPSFNWGHRVSFTGGYAVKFCPDSNKWSEPVDFTPLCESENCEEVLFVANNTVHILLFENYGDLVYKSLFKWCPTDLKWVGIDLESGDCCKQHLGDNRRIDVVVASGDDNSDTVYLIVGNDGSFAVHKLCVTSGKVEKCCDIAEQSMLIPRGKPTSAAVKDNDLYFSYGVHGCGFRWESSRLVKLNLETGEGCEHEVAGEQPNFCFSGAKGNAVTNDGRWLHIAGSIQVGMCGSKNCSDVQALTLAEPYAWTKLNVEIPDQCCGEDFVSAFDQSTGTLYVACKEGVVAGQI